MSPFVLSALKYSLLLLLYFFIFRAIRATVTDLRRTGAREARPRKASAPRRAKQKPRGKGPGSVVVRDAEGRKLAARKLKGSLDVGRGESCSIRVEDSYVSQQHARLFLRDGSWLVEDLGSTNGTYLNDQRVTSPMPVRPGDLVKVGKTVLELRR